MVRFNRYSILAAAMLVFVGSVAPAVAAETPQEKSPDTYELLELFGEVFNRVREQYVEKVSDKKLIESAIQGMLRDLDPHSVYLNEDNYQAMQTNTRGEFGGLGIEVTMDESGYVKVVSPIDDTPASRAGIQAGDLITALDGKPVQGMTLNDAVDLMRGPVGAQIKLTILRGKQEAFDVTLTRDKITIQSVRSHTEGDIGYIRITSFSAQTQSGLDEAIDKITKKLGDKLEGYVLDLRNNPGGLLDQAISVADTFLDQGEIVSTRGRNPEDASRFQATPGDRAHGLPIVVLINGGSASASEIVSGALQDHHRAILVGTRSFGKGSVQTIMPLSRKGTAIKLTTQRYYTPSGRSIQATGIEPDIKVEVAKVEHVDNGKVLHEADLRGALTNEGGTKDETKKKDDGETKMTSDVDDYQLSRALDIIRGIAIYRTQAAN